MNPGNFVTYQGGTAMVVKASPPDADGKHADGEYRRPLGSVDLLVFRLPIDLAFHIDATECDLLESSEPAAGLVPAAPIAQPSAVTGA